MYLPRINKTLQGFKEGWNNHGIRTAGHKSPNQLIFVQGVLRLQNSNSGLTALDFSEHIDDAYGMDDDDSGPRNAVEGAVVPQAARSSF